MVKHWRTGLMLVCVAIMLIAHSASYSPKIYSQKTYVQQSDSASHSVQLDSVRLDNKTKALNSANTSAITQSDAQVVKSCGALNNNVTDASSVDSATTLPIPCSNSDYVSHSDDLNFAPINSSRFISLAQHDMREVKPTYLLAVDFTVESTPNLIEPINVDITSDWTLAAASSPARISGWKVSNLQYRFSQQAA
ncbi:hypothetical protein [Shewanella morhuae]